MRTILLVSCFLGLLLALPTESEQKLDAQMTDALFGLSLTALKESNGPVVVSPFSVAMALATVNEGAKEKTSQEITDVAFHGISKEKVASWFKSKLEYLKTDYSPLSVASAIYIQKTLNVLEGYITDVKENFLSSVDKVDFAGEPQIQRQKINSFVNETTQGHIPELLGAEHVSSDTRMIAVNALYMKSSFKDKFPKGSTAKKPFHNEDKSSKELDTMSGTHSGRFFENDDFAYGDMPFTDYGYNFFIVFHA
uniref:SERPIN domain-containing protein n=1 Tax=Steinernema glaseri TaxID=37863 RepID=A0A1I8ABD0_9BILA